MTILLYLRDGRPLYFVQDTPGSSRAAVARLKVFVKDVNNKIPLFQGTDENGIYPAAVSSYTRRGDTIIYVTAIDLDRDPPNNVVTYSFRSNCADCSYFLLDSNTGEIKSNAASFDASVKPSYTLYVIARDGAPSSLPATNPNPNQQVVIVQVKVTGVNYVTPYFASSVYNVSVVEGQPQFTDLLSITANLDPNDLAQYQIQAGNNLRRIAVNSSTGNIYSVGELLVTTQRVYTLTYRVFDGVVSATTQVVITLIQKNMFPPVFNPISFTCNNLVENIQTGTMLTVNAFDPDVTRTGSIAYSLPYASSSGAVWSPNVTVNTPELFQSIIFNSININAATGVLSLTNYMGRDLPSGFSDWQFSVAANDEAGSSTSLVGYGYVNLILIDLNNHAPVFDTCCLNGSVAEGAPAGSSVMQLYATDVDDGPNGTVVFSLADSSLLFAVSTSGLVTTTASGSSTLDKETQDTYFVNTRACDQGSPPKCVNQQVMIKVLDSNDNPPSFGIGSYAVTIPEMMPVGSSVIAVSASDRDTSSRLTYSVSGSGSQNFYADSIYTARTGVVRIQQLVPAVSVSSTYSVNVLVSDGYNPSAGTSVAVTVIDINDHAPVFTPASYSSSISESKQVGTTIVTVTASDADFGINANFSYFVDYANTDPLYNFGVDPQSGAVFLQKPLDRETQQFISLRILAIDTGTPPQTGSASIGITVTDANDNAPNLVFDPAWPLVVKIATQAGQTVTCFNASDPDVSQRPVYTFSYICNSVPCRDFTLITAAWNQACLVAARSGYSRSILGFKSYTISVNISDNGTPVQWAVRQFTLVVESTNDNPPKPGTKTIVVNTLNGVFNNVPIGNVNVDDPDDWDLSDETFQFDNPSTSDPFFTLNSVTGQLTMAAGATKGNHTLSVKVTSKKWQVSVVCTVNVVVRYYNDSAVESSASIRLSGVGDASDLLMPGSSGSPSKIVALQQALATQFGTSYDNVDILSLRNAADNPGSVDVTFAAHGSPYYSSEKLNSIVLMNAKSIQQSTGLTVAMAPVDLCAVETANCSAGCNTIMVADSSPLLVNINGSSFTGVNVNYLRSCEACSSLNTVPWTSQTCSLASCLNGGKCQQNWNGYK